MKKITRFLLVFGLLLINLNVSLYAMRQPYRTIDIYISDFNDDIDDYYVDILIKGDSCVIESTDENKRIVQEYAEGGFVGGLSCNKGISKTVTSKERRRDHHQFAGELPQDIKIIIVKKDHSVIVSEVVNLEAYNSVVYYQVNNNKITLQNVYLNVFALGIFIFVLSIICKLVIFYFFRFSINSNLKIFLPINIITSGILSAIISMTNYFDGYLFAIKNLLFLQIVFLIIESLFFLFRLKEYPKIKRILYSFTASLATLTVTLLCILISIF